MTLKQIRRIALIKAHLAVRNSDHDTARRMFAMCGISYIEPTKVEGN